MSSVNHNGAFGFLLVHCALEIMKICLDKANDQERAVVTTFYFLS